MSAPDSYHDNLNVGALSELSPEALADKTNQYGEFLQADPMPRARRAATRILDHLLFEMAWQDGVYDDLITSPQEGQQNGE